MTPLHALTALLAQNERQRDIALAEHLRAVAASQAATAQAEQLRTYRREYEQRWSAQFCLEGKIELVRCYQSFMERLTLAVDHQAQIEQGAALQVTRAQLAVRDAELRCASVRKLMERRAQEQRLATERSDQKQSDEYAARAAWTQRGVGGHPRTS
jgi:flagellar FliJ protein